jgi:precorrin-6Y C5,15-methyltransferase (decarboxylating)
MPDLRADKRAWVSPFADNLPRLQALRGRRVVVLASGDPQWFGIGATLSRTFPAEDLTILPHPGAFSLAAARLGWALQDCLCLTVHGRPLESLSLFPGARLLVLAEDGGSPARIAALLCRQGYGSSRLTVLERLGGPDERLFTQTADAAWEEPRFHDLNTIAVAVAGPAGIAASRLAGLPDEAYLHDGQLTKREIRAATLALLAPWPGARLWDLGAGAGSVAIEWMRAGGQALAVERDAVRCQRIAENAARLGVPGLVIRQQELGAFLLAAADEAPPQAIFLGGGLSQPGLLQSCWQALPTGGRLVANGVTAEAEAALLSWQARQGGSLTRLAISRLAATGRFHSWHPLMPVTQYLGVKGEPSP